MMLRLFAGLFFASLNKRCCVSRPTFRFERTSPHGNQISTAEMAAQCSEGCYDQLAAQSMFTSVWCAFPNA
ncbi:unnamed protein product, partial [Ectocarpus sp. 8 AP-2014]